MNPHSDKNSKYYVDNETWHRKYQYAYTTAMEHCLDDKKRVASYGSITAIEALRLAFTMPHLQEHDFPNAFNRVPKVIKAAFVMDENPYKLAATAPHGGVYCERCGEGNEYAGPNMANGKYRCYKCRT